MQTLEAGTQFGPYTIEGYVAGGGMGEVYAARNTVYGSPVALKVLHPRLHRQETWRRRFNEEGLVGTQLKHPHILSARELVEHDGRIALVMDLISGGQTVLRVMDREYASGLPLTDALQLMLKILQGVEYLHGKEIIHGDIKPENVMIQGNFREPATWLPSVTDFGTVALIADPVMVGGRPAVVATPRYASPEHMLGVDQVKVGSDIYCLGLLLHFLLCAQHASPATTVEEAAEAVRAPVSLVHLVDHPESVRAIVARAAAPRLGDRYASVREMALAVRDVLDALGAGLDLQDLSADLATEIVEEQAERQRELARQAEAELAAQDDTDLELGAAVGSDTDAEEEEEEPQTDPLDEVSEVEVTVDALHAATPGEADTGDGGATDVDGLPGALVAELDGSASPGDAQPSQAADPSTADTLETAPVDPVVDPDAETLVPSQPAVPPRTAAFMVLVGLAVVLAVVVAVGFVLAVQ